MAAQLDVLAVEVVEFGLPEQPPRLSRRHRHIVLAVDQWENQASVWFVRRGHSGHPVDVYVQLERSGPNASWSATGGGGSEPGTLPSDRVSMSELPELGRGYPDSHLQTFCSTSGTSMGRSTASFHFQAVVEATALTFSDRQQRLIPDHGCCMVVYNPKRPPTMTVLGGNGAELASVRLPGRRRLLR